mgnify:CR=1 FL=1
MKRPLPVMTALALALPGAAQPTPEHLLTWSQTHWALVAEGRVPPYWAQAELFS